MGRRDHEPKATKGLGATLRQEKKTRSFTIDVSIFSGLKRIKWVPISAAIAISFISTMLLLYWDEVIYSVDREVTKIEIRGQLKYQQPDVLQNVLNKHLGEGFFSLDLNAVKSEVEAMPWIYSASLRRRWPGTLMITVKEQYPVASWNGEFYLNEYGEVFRPPESVEIEAIPDLLGPTDRAKDVLTQYVSYREQLAVVDEGVALLSLEKRGAWRLRLKSGIDIKLGRAPLEEKLNRFLRAYKQDLSSKVSEIQSIDARYTNGIAVRWKDVPASEAEQSDSI